MLTDVKIAGVSPRSFFRTQAFFAAAGVVVLGALFELLRRLGDLRLYVVETIALGLAAGVAYLILLYLFEHSSDQPSAFWLILAGALLFRLLLFPLSPALSDDMYRYLWDARVQEQGYNPYGIRPDDPRLGPLRDENFARVSGPDIPTVYPPLTQIVFRVSYSVLRDPVSLKLPFVLADLLVVGMLAWWFRTSGGRNFALAVYAWNPLIIVEFAASGHYDSIALACTLAACLLVASRREVLSMLLLAAGALTKAYPALLIPLWLRRSGWPQRKQGWLNALAALLLVTVCVLPFWRAWPEFLSSMRYYQTSWMNNNSSLAALLDWFSGSHEVTVGVGAGIVTGLALWAAARRLDSMRAAYLLIGAALLLSPNAFPWYFSWIVPFLCFFPSRAWLLLTVLHFLSYHVLIGYQAFGVWRFEPFYLFLSYGPFFLLLLGGDFLPGYTGQKQE